MVLVLVKLGPDAAIEAGRCFNEHEDRLGNADRVVECHDIANKVSTTRASFGMKC